MNGHGYVPVKLYLQNSQRAGFGLRTLCSLLTLILKVGPLVFIAQEGTQFLLASSLPPTSSKHFSAGNCIARILIKGQNVLAQVFFCSPGFLSGGMGRGYLSTNGPDGKMAGCPIHLIPSICSKIQTTTRKKPKRFFNIFLQVEHLMEQKLHHQWHIESK